MYAHVLQLKSIFTPVLLVAEKLFRSGTATTYSIA